MRLANYIIVALVISLLLQSRFALAGPYTDDLTKCIIESTTTQDRTAIVRWMFTAMSRHPGVKDLSIASKDQCEKANKSFADLFMRMITVSCKQQAVNAIKYEGEIALEKSFNLLGQVAAKEIFSHPDVAAALAGLEKLVDSDKLKSILNIK